MNHVFRIVWNDALRVWQAVAEAASSRGKCKSSKAARVTRGLGAMAVATAAGIAQAQALLPTGGQIVGGTGSITSSGNTLTVTQGSQRMAADWQSFSIGAGATVNFVQPGASAVALNRVLGADVSVIQGALNANGHLFLLNPNGVLFTPTAQVNVGGIVASTLGMSAADFMAGNYRLQGASASAVVNQGRIDASRTIGLVAAKIVNDGTLTAHGGSVQLAAASDVTLDLGGPLKLQVNKGALDAQVDNGGAVYADGGLVYLTARALDELSTAVINQTGLLRAQTLATGDKGEILLIADMKTGVANIGGSLDASAPNGGDGGFIDTSAAQVNLKAGLSVTAAAAFGSGGEWLVDPQDITIGATEAATYSDTLNTGTNVRISTEGAGAAAGDITVNSAITKTQGSGATLTLRADRNININAGITSTSGRLNIVLSAANGAGATVGGVRINANLASNGGNILIGGAANAGTWVRTALQNMVTPADIGYALNYQTAGGALGAAVEIAGGTSITTGGGDLVLKGRTTATSNNLSGGIPLAGVLIQTGSTSVPTLLDAQGGNVLISGISTGSGNVWGVAMPGGSNSQMTMIRTSNTRGHIVLDATNSVASTTALSMQNQGGSSQLRIYMPSVAHLLPLINGSVDIATFTNLSANNNNQVGYAYGGSVEIPGTNASYKYATYFVNSAPVRPIYGVYDGTRVYDGSTAASLGTMTATYPYYFNAPAGMSTDATYGLAQLNFATASKNVGNYNAMEVWYSGTPEVRNPLSPVRYAGTDYAVQFFGSYRITPAAITPTAQNRVYDGSTAPSIAAAGVLAGDSVNFNYTSGAFASANVGTWAVNVHGMSLSGSDARNYTLASTSFETTASITPRPLGIAVNGTYNGTTSFSGHALSFSPTVAGSGLVSGETITGVTVDSKDVAGNASNYITSVTGAGGFLASNYTIGGSIGLAGRTADASAGVLGDTNNTVTLGRAALGVQVTGTYNGASEYLTANGATITAAGLVNEETLTGVTLASRNVFDNDGNYVTAFTAGTADLSNYLVSGSRNTGTVGDGISTGHNSVALAAAPLGVSVSGTYNGTTTLTTAAGATINAYGLVGQDTAQGTAVTAATLDSRNVADATRVVSLSGTGAFDVRNYVLNGSVNTAPATAGAALDGSQATNTAALGRASLTVSGAQALDKVYDGNDSAEIVGATLVGLMGSDAAGIAGGGTFMDRNVGDAKPVSATLVVTGDAAVLANYSLTQPTGLNAAITPRELSASLVGSLDKTYDANSILALGAGNFQLSGFIAGESGSVFVATGQFNSPNVSQADTVTATLAAGNYTAGADTLLSNYALPTTASGAGSIRPATLIYVANSVRVNSGDALPQFTGTVSGFVAGETIATATTGTLRFSSEGATGDQIGAFPILGAGLGALFGNYVFEQAPGNASALAVEARPAVPSSPVVTPVITPVVSPIIVPAFVDNGSTALGSIGAMSVGGLNYLSVSAPATDNGTTSGTLQGPPAASGGTSAGELPGDDAAVELASSSLGIETEGGRRRAASELNINNVTLSSANGQLDVLVIGGGVNRNGATALEQEGQ